MNDPKAIAVQLVQGLPAAPTRPSDAHKGTFGHVLVVAGSEGMSGAAILAGRAALHGGAGLVTVAVPRCILDIVAGGHPSYMTIPLDDDHGRIDRGALATIGHRITERTVIAVGPGLGQSAGARFVVRELYESCPQPMVVDADGLNVLAGEAVLPYQGTSERILTPHPGEFARLTKLAMPAIEADRVQVAVEFAKRHRVVMVLKGEGTVITDGERYAINRTGNGALATGGSGDVLTGLVAALLAQRLDAFSAAQLGAHLHGLAADCAVEEVAAEYMTSADLLGHLNTAWLRFHQRHS